MFDLITSDTDDVVQEKSEEDSHFTIKNDTSEINCSSYQSDALCAVSSSSVIKEDSCSDEKIKLENETVLPTTVQTCDVHVKVEFQDIVEAGKEDCKLSIDSQLNTTSTMSKDKEKKKKLLSNKRKQDSQKQLPRTTRNIDKKKSVNVKKYKHKKYEKPSEQVVKHYKCTLCPKVFQRSSNFNAHQRTHNPLTARPFSCQDCKNTFHYRCQLRDHARVHTGERPFKCHSCSKTFARKGCLVAHMITHSDALPFQCDICRKRFARKYNLAKHVQSHSGDRPFRCIKCSRRFKCKQSLDKHHRIHELNIYSCAICQESFDTKRRLTHHKINEHVSYRPFTCQICHKPFIFKSQLTYHIKEHNLERPYSCIKCNKSYFKKGHLLSHIKQYCSDGVPVPQVKLEVLT